MKYDHMVKANGRYYQTGEDVPEISEKAVDKTPLPFSDSDIEFDEIQKPEKKYTRSEIQLMKTADLQNLAMSLGIEGADEMTGGTLKKLLIEHFGL